MKKVFTSGQVAKLCNVAPRTVSKWFDTGRLKGYRMPGSNDRRIPRESLIRFLRENGMPTGELEAEARFKVLVVGAAALTVDRLKEFLPTPTFQIETAPSLFAGGVLLKDLQPDAVVIDLALGRSDGLAIAASIRGQEGFAATMLVALTNDDEAAPGELIEGGFSQALQKPINPRDLVEPLQARRSELFEDSTRMALQPA